MTGSEQDQLDEVLAGVHRRVHALRLTESEVDGQASRRGLPTIADFRHVGLCQEDAVDAARGLVEGMYFSFEDACNSRAAFNRHGRTHLDHAAVGESAKRFAVDGSGAVRESQS